MKTRIVAIMAFGVLLAVACPVSAATIGISSVNVVPIQPTNIDLITFYITGGASTSPSYVEYDLFSQNGTSLRLDLYVDTGFLTAISNWDYSKQIQPLPLGAYSIEINAFDNFYGTLQDTHNVNFTVTPEPTTIAIFGFALPFFRAFTRRKL